MRTISLMIGGIGVVPAAFMLRALRVISQSWQFRHDGSFYIYVVYNAAVFQFWISAAILALIVLTAVALSKIDDEP